MEHKEDSEVIAQAQEMSSEIKERALPFSEFLHRAPVSRTSALTGALFNKDKTSAAWLVQLTGQNRP